MSRGGRAVRPSQPSVHRRRRRLARGAGAEPLARGRGRRRAAVRRCAQRPAEHLQGRVPVGSGSQVRGRAAARRDRARRAIRAARRESRLHVIEPELGSPATAPVEHERRAVSPRRRVERDWAAAALVDTRHEYEHLFSIYVPIAIGVFAVIVLAIAFCRAALPAAPSRRGRALAREQPARGRLRAAARRASSRSCCTSRSPPSTASTRSPLASGRASPST